MKKKGLSKKVEEVLKYTVVYRKKFKEMAERMKSRTKSGFYLPEQIKKLDDMEGLFDVMEKQLKEGHFEGAQESCEWFGILIESLDEDGRRLDEALDYMEEALDYFIIGVLDKGIAAINKALEIVPNYGRGYSSRAVAHLQNDEFGKALEDFTKAIQLDPSLKKGLKHFISYTKKGLKKHAKEKIAKSAEEENEFERLQRELSESIKAEQYEKAAEMRDKITTLEKSYQNIDMIQAQCPFCAKKYSVSFLRRGKKLKCGECLKEFKVE